MPSWLRFVVAAVVVGVAVAVVGGVFVGVVVGVVFAVAVVVAAAGRCGWLFALVIKDDLIVFEH